MAGLPASQVRGKVLERVRGFGPNVLTLREGGSAGVPQPRPGETVVFTSFLTTGLAPPFSEFLRYALSHYGIHLPHLVPNSIVIRSTFAHLSAMFFGIPRLSPLRERAHLACYYRGVDDKTRTFVGGKERATVASSSLTRTLRFLTPFSLLFCF